MHVAAGAECLVAGAGQEHDTDVLALAAVGERLRHFPCGQWREGVAVTLAVDGDFRDMVILLEKDFLEVESFDFVPDSCHYMFSFMCL